MRENNVKLSRSRRRFPSPKPALRGECYMTLLSIHEQRNPLSALHLSLNLVKYHHAVTGLCF